MSRVNYLCTHLSLTKRINCTWKSMQSSVAFKQATELNTGTIKADNPWLNQTRGQGHPQQAACERSRVNHTHNNAHPGQHLALDTHTSDSRKMKYSFIQLNYIHQKNEIFSFCALSSIPSLPGTQRLELLSAPSPEWKGVLCPHQHLLLLLLTPHPSCLWIWEGLGSGLGFCSLGWGKKELFVNPHSFPQEWHIRAPQQLLIQCTALRTMPKCLSFKTMHRYSLSNSGCCILKCSLDLWARCVIKIMNYVLVHCI